MKRGRLLTKKIHRQECPGAEHIGWIQPNHFPNIPNHFLYIPIGFIYKSIYFIEFPIKFPIWALFWPYFGPIEPITTFEVSKV